LEIGDRMPEEKHLGAFERAEKAADVIHEKALKKPVPLSEVVKTAEEYAVHYTSVLRSLEIRGCRLDPERGVVCVE